jgi:flagellar protein FlbD
MILVHRLTGDSLVVNADHIERIEETPDTVLTLLDGKKILVKDSMSEVVDLVVAYRASILNLSYQPRAHPGEGTLQLVHSDADKGSAADLDEENR